MMAFTPQAQHSLDRYMQQVKLALRGTSVDVIEVERDVREHIDSELSGREDPVSQQILDEVLGRLGSPDQWVPEDELPQWRRIVRRLATGPEDWRLAYLCFGLTVLGLITVPIGGPLLWVAAYLLARSAVSLSEERAEPLGARRWLVYPILALVSAGLALILLIGPLVAPVAWAIDAGMVQDMDIAVDGEIGPVLESLVYTALVGAAMGCWWMLLAPFAAIAVQPIRRLLVPLADRFERRHALWLGIAGLFVAGACIGFLILI